MNSENTESNFRRVSGAAIISDVSPERVLDLVGQAVGGDRVSIHKHTDCQIGNEGSRVVAQPQSEDELAEVLRLASAESWRVIPAGAGTWLEMGNIPARFHLIVSTSRIDKLLDYEPADLTATMQAGHTLSAFNRTAGHEGQWIALDPFGSPDSTIGATIATASSGPLRCGYGTPRDWLIGIRVAHIDGRMTRAGGKVVKNVAGYDLGKLYTGSFGTLAIITEATFRLRSLSPADKSIVFHSKRASDLLALVSQIRQSPLQPAAMELISPQSLFPLSIDGSSHCLVLRFLHEAEAVETQIGEASEIGRAHRPLTLGQSEGAIFWQALHESETDTGWELSLRLSGLPADLPTLIAEVEKLLPSAHYRAHANNGVLRVHTEAGGLDHLGRKWRARKLVELRQRLQAIGGQLVVLRAPLELRDQLDVWGDPGETLGLMRAIKAQYDPHGLLNSERFVAGI